MGLTRFAIKASIAGGAVYYTVREGLWSRPEDSIRFYKQMYGRIAPYVMENVPKDLVKEIPDIPSGGEIKNYLTTYWNKGVIASTDFMADSPAHLLNAVTSLSNLVQKQFAQTSQ